MSNQLKETVEEIQFKHKLTQAEIASRAGITREHLVREIKKGAEGKVLNTIRRAFPDVSVQRSQNITPSPERSESEGQTVTAAMLQEMISNTTTLVKTNALLSETNATQTRIVDRLTRTTVEPDQDILKVFDAKLTAALGLIAKAGVHGWKSEQEALAEVSRIIYGSQKKVKAKGIHSDSGS